METSRYFFQPRLVKSKDNYVELSVFENDTGGPESLEQNNVIMWRVTGYDEDNNIPRAFLESLGERLETIKPKEFA